ncbi:STAS domain-containing protein [Streptomyces sp. ALI-76-A]|uniref:STAS domain-containing protein n=1 Tax=Streptomyces sp. ALI-76-A TaxID=3025736 RepID=UPI00256F074F|nr:STAS domain-containing protein [Streptomyces sp. ALI-76-A]MDL5205238.1 STAS domain-containing protein [Streptomyces sp. ALI-76-A]
MLDLRSPSFTDRTGLGLPGRARDRVRARHGRFRLVGASPHFLRVLRRVRLTGVFEVYPRGSDAWVRQVAGPAARN